MADKSSKTSAKNAADKPEPAPELIKSLRKRLNALQAGGRRALLGARARTRLFSEKIRNKTGPAVKNTTAWLGHQGRRSSKALAASVTTGLLPPLKRFAQGIARRLHPGSLLLNYRSALRLFHRLGPDRQIERLCFVPTSKHVPLSIVRVPHQLRRSGHDYRPTPRLVFKWAMQALPEPIERYEFIDYGAGRGRVLLMASQYPFEKITGAEIAEELCDDCLLNIAQFPRSLMKCRDVDCQHLSALRLPVPEGETVFYLNNPFDRGMLERVIAHMAKSYRQEPRRFYVMCVDIDARDLFEDTGIFKAVPIAWRQRLKTGIFSPYSIALYRTIH